MLIILKIINTLKSFWSRFKGKLSWKFVNCSRCSKCDLNKTKIYIYVDWMFEGKYLINAHLYTSIVYYDFYKRSLLGNRLAFLRNYNESLIKFGDSYSFSSYSICKTTSSMWYCTYHWIFSWKGTFRLCHINNWIVKTYIRNTYSNVKWIQNIDKPFELIGWFITVIDVSTGVIVSAH